MLNSLTYKKKNILLLVGSLLFSIVMYQLSIEETIDKKNEYQSGLLKSKELANAPQIIAQLKNELHHIDNLIGSSHAENIDVQQLILENVTSYCNENQLFLKKFPQPSHEAEQNYQVETTKLMVQGNFIPLLKLVYEFEQNYNLGKVVSVEFDTKKELKTRKNRLFATLFIQNIKKN